jgi:hypothetical protein
MNEVAAKSRDFVELKSKHDESLRQVQNTQQELSVLKQEKMSLDILYSDTLAKCEQLTLDMEREKTR